MLDNGIQDFLLFRMIQNSKVSYSQKVAAKSTLERKEQTARVNESCGS